MFFIFFNFKQGGESVYHVEQRMLQFLKDLVTPLYNSQSKEPIHIGVFGHGFAIKCALKGILEFSPAMVYKVDIGNTSITEVGFDQMGWHVFRVNDSSHLYLCK